MAGGTISGVGDISFAAADTGSGLYEAVFLIDGRAVSKQILNGGSGPCRNVGGTSDGSNAFFAVEPCPLALSDDLAFDTALAPDGSHLFTVQLLDAAHNATTISNREVTFANHTASVPAGAGIGPGSPLALRGPANGTNASDQATLSARWTSTAKTTHTSGYGQANRITGRLTAPGSVPISGASLGVYATSVYEGARTVRLAAVRTGPTGRWTLSLPRDSSSSALRLEYRSRQNDRSPSPPLPSRCEYTPGSRCASHRVSRASGERSSSAVLCTERRSHRAASSSCWRPARAGNGSSSTRSAPPRRAAIGRATASSSRPDRLPVPCPLVHEADFPFLGGTSNVVGVYER